MESVAARSPSSPPMSWNRGQGQSTAMKSFLCVFFLSVCTAQVAQLDPTKRAPAANLSINAASYAGVDPTGTSDSAAGLDAAFGAAYAGTNGGTVYVPCGVYLRSTTWAVNGSLSPEKSVRIQGAYDKCVIIKPSVNSIPVFSLGVFAQLENLSIDGDRKTSITGVSFAASNAIVRNVTITNVSRGFDLIGGAGAVHGPENNHVFQARVANVANGVYVLQNGGSVHWPNANNFYSVVVTGATSAAWYNNGGDGNNCYGCLFQSNAGFGIQMISGQGNKFLGGWLEKNTLGNIYHAIGAGDPSGNVVEMFGADSYTTVISTTGSIDVGANPNLLKVASATNIVPGKNITVVGAGRAGGILRTWVRAVGGTSVTINDAAATSIVGAAVYGTDLTRTQSLRIGGQQFNTELGSVFLRNPEIFDMVRNPTVGTTDVRTYNTPSTTTVYEYDNTSSSNVVRRQDMSTGAQYLPKGYSGAAVGKAACWTTGGKQGWCTTAAGADGTCTCTAP